MLKRSLIAFAALMVATPIYAADLSVDGMIRMNSTAVTATVGSNQNTATCNSKACVVTSAGSITISSTGDYDFIISNSNVEVGDMALAQIIGGTNTAGLPVIESVNTSVAGRVTLKLANAHIQTALSGTVQFAVFLFKP